MLAAVGTYMLSRGSKILSSSTLLNNKENKKVKLPYLKVIDSPLKDLKKNLISP